MNIGLSINREVFWKRIEKIVEIVGLGDPVCITGLANQIVS